MVKEVLGDVVRRIDSDHGPLKGRKREGLDTGRGPFIQGTDYSRRKRKITLLVSYLGGISELQRVGGNFTGHGFQCYIRTTADASPRRGAKRKREEDIFLLGRGREKTGQVRQSRGLYWCPMRQLGRLIEAGERRVSDSDAVRSTKYIYPSLSLSHRQIS